MRDDELRRWNLQMFADEGEDENKGEGSEGGSAEDADNGGTQEKTFSQDEVNRLVEKRLAKERAKLKAETEKQVKDAQEEAAKLARMNAEQKREYEQEKLKQQMDAIKAENEALKKEALRTQLGQEAAAILKESKIEATPDILEFVVGDDAETTKAKIGKFVSVIQAQIKAHDIERATGSVPKNYGGSKDKPDPFQAIINKYHK